MDLWSLVTLLLRRKLVVAPVLLLVMAGGLLWLRQIPPIGVASATWVLVPENADAAAQAQGGQAGLNDDQTRLQAEVIERVVEGPVTRERLVQTGATADYQIDLSDTGGLINVTAFGDDPAVVLSTAQAVMTVIEDEARKRAVAGRTLQATVLARPEDTRPVQSTASGADAVASSGSLLLEPAGSSASGGGAGLNPFILLGASTTTVLAEYVTAPSFAAAVAERAEGGYEVVGDQLAPLLRVRATAPDEPTASATLDAVFEQLQTEMNARQDAAGAPEATWLRLQVLAGPDVATEAPGTMKLLVVIGILGVLAAVSSALLVDGLLNWRRSRPPKVKDGDHKGDNKGDNKGDGGAGSTAEGTRSEVKVGST